MTIPLLEEVIEAGIEQALEDVNTAQPGKVVAFDGGSHTVSVQPLLKRRYEDENGDIVAYDPPVITKVPLVYPGAGNYRITFPVKPGAGVLLVHTHGALDAWQHSSTGDTVDMDNVRRHAMTDAIAVPGINSVSGASGDSGRVDDDALVIHTDDKIKLGGGTTSPVIREADMGDAIGGVLSNTSVLAAIDALKIAIGPAIPVAQEAVKAAVLLHFTTNPTGSSVVEAE